MKFMKFSHKPRFALHLKKKIIEIKIRNSMLKVYDFFFVFVYISQFSSSFLFKCVFNVYRDSVVKEIKKGKCLEFRLQFVEFSLLISFANC